MPAHRRSVMVDHKTSWKQVQRHHAVVMVRAWLDPELLAMLASGEAIAWIRTSGDRWPRMWIGMAFQHPPEREQPPWPTFSI